MIPYPGFIGGAYAHRLSAVDAQECINLIPKPADSRHAHPFLEATPGLRRWLDDGLAGRIRGQVVHKDRMFAIAYNQVGECTEALDGTRTFTQIGDVIEADSRLATMSGNAIGQILIVSAKRGYILDTTANTLTQITDPGFPGVADALGPVMGCYIGGGYFAVLASDYTTWHVCQVENGLVWPGNFAAKNLTPDGIRALIPVQDRVLLAGPYNTEVWYLSQEDFPYSPSLDATFAEGIFSTHAWAVLGKVPFWVGSNKDGDRGVFRLEGYAPVRISTPGLEQRLGAMTQTHDWFAWTYEDEGQGFFNISMPSEGATFSYDARTGEWHRRGYYNLERSAFEAHRASGHCRFKGKHLVGSLTEGIIYELTYDAHDDDGNPRVWLRRAPFVGANEEPLFHQALALTYQRGAAPLAPNDPPAKVMLRYSDDDAQTWSTPIWQELSRRGEYARKAEWRQLGRPDGQRTYEASGSHASVTALTGAFLELERAA